jgi:hypothetical protein
VSPRDPSATHRRALVPGELRHVALDRGFPDLDIVAAIAALFGRRRTGKPIRHVAVTVETWGLAVDGSVIPWRQVASVAHRKLNRGSRETPREFSQLEFELSDRILRAEHDYELSLDLLALMFRALRHESECLIATSLTGGAEPARLGLFDQLLTRTRGWLASDAGRAETTVIEGDYRNAERSADAAFVCRLADFLSEAPHDADRGPVAAIVAAELGLGSLENQLAALVSSAHPFVAAVATGAALRLGVSQIRVGKVDHVEPYIDAETSRAIAAWAGGA